MDYHEFLISKIPTIPKQGFTPDSSCPEWFKPHQVDCSHWAIEKGRAALFESFGMGKCHGKGTLILMADGSIKAVEDIRAGDQLMGDDSTPRNVISLARGSEMLYRVTLKNGDSYTCNESHIFSLIMSNKHEGNKHGDIVSKSVMEFLALPEYAQRNCYKHYKVAVEFEEQQVPFDAYLYGAWLGDGHSKGMSWTINDEDTQITDRIFSYAKNAHMQVRVEDGSGCKTIHLGYGAANNAPHPVRTFLRENAEGGKNIDRRYLKNNRDVRLQVLAGLIDTDGYLTSKCFEVATKWKEMRDDILYLSRSLGFSVSNREKIVDGVTYYRILISGDTHLIPCITRKKAGIREQIKSPLVYGFSVEQIGVGEYFGFEIDGNHLYLLADFTVTHNTVQQLQIMKWVHERTGGKVLFVAPLGVRQEFTLNDGPRMGMKVIYCRTNAEVAAADSPYIITNYERVRDGGIDPAQFTGATLDEASCLRSYGSLTTQTFVELFRDIPYRFVATATPSPNEFLELINYAHFLGVMDRGQALTRFFQRDSKKAGNLTLYPHMEDQFWLWVASWAVFVNRPSDLGYSDEGYDLPELNVQWHEVQADQGQPGDFRDSFGQALLFEKPGGGIKHVAKNRRKTKDQRIQKAADIIAADPDSHWIIWHYLESERAEIQKLIPDSVAVYGSQDIDDREQIVQDFSNGKISKLSSKPELLGSGCNFQRHCHKAIFIGPTDKFNDFIQACFRIQRFQQKHPVQIHIIYADTQYDTVVIMRNKWERHNELTLRMREIIKQHGLSGEALRMKFERTLGTKRVEVTGKTYRAIHNDCVEELKNFESDSIDEIVTSIPFSDHYEYSPSINDFGHNNGDEGFFKQFDFLVPELLRVLKPGRIAAIHTKDRIQYGKMTGNGMYTVNAFSDKTVQAFQKHGFLYMGRITIDTDVVRENAQSYRLGWSENAEDSTKMGCGSTEFVLLFRKWEPAYSPNGTANGPEPVKKDNSAYTRSHWQLQACGIWRSNGNELLSPEMIARMTMGDIMYWWKSYCETNGYDYEKHVQFCQAVEDLGHLPSGHMLFPPSSNNPDIWTDILRINTLNTALSMKQEQSHVCLAEGSMVLTHKGYKPIEEIDLGDLVLTHKGRWMPVIAKQCTGVNDVVQVKAQGVHNLTLTPTHKVWARNGNGVAKAKQKAISSEPDWVQAKDLENCYVNLKMPPTMEPANTNKLHWWLVGRWLADGHFGARGCVYISVGRHKQASFEAKVGELVGPPSGRTTALQYRVRDAGSAVRDILEDCGHGATGKHIPAIAYTLPEEYAKELLDGYLSGDGHFNADRNKWYCSSVSKELLMGLNFLVQRVHGDIASLHPGREAGTAVIEGRTVDTQQEWILSWGHKSYSFSFMADDGAWKRVKSIVPAGQATTWNIRVAEDESYTAEGCVVKNCPLQLDVIQRLIERFSNPGDTILDPFGGVHSVPYQAIKMGRKGVGIELNPEYWRMGVSFCERAEQKLLAPTLFDLELAEA